MASLLSRLLAFYLQRARRPVFATAEGLRAEIPRARAREDHRPPPKVVGGLQVHRRQVQGHPVYELAMKGARGTPLLYLHGGAFCFEITRFHWNLIAELAVATNRPVIVPIYPLAPDHSASEVLAYLLEIWGEMTASGASPVILGDSAGGNLALVLTMLAAERGLPGPSALGLLSSCVDMTLRHPEIPAYEARDPWLASAGALEAVRLYAKDLALSDWRISPALGDLSLLPPSLLLIGTRELLYPDLRDMAARARSLGRPVELLEGPGMMHVWPLLPIPEARPAKAQLIAFVRRHAGP